MGKKAKMAYFAGGPKKGVLGAHNPAGGDSAHLIICQIGGDLSVTALDVLHLLVPGAWGGPKKDPRGPPAGTPKKPSFCPPILQGCARTPTHPVWPYYGGLLRISSAARNNFPTEIDSEITKH